MIVRTSQQIQRKTTVILQDLMVESIVISKSMYCGVSVTTKVNTLTQTKMVCNNGKVPKLAKRLRI